MSTEIVELPVVEVVAPVAEEKKEDCGCGNATLSDPKLDVAELGKRKKGRKAKAPKKSLSKKASKGTVISAKKKGVDLSSSSVGDKLTLGKSSYEVRRLGKNKVLVRLFGSKKQ